MSPGAVEVQKCLQELLTMHRVLISAMLLLPSGRAKPQGTPAGRCHHRGVKQNKPREQKPRWFLPPRDALSSDTGQGSLVSIRSSRGSFWEPQPPLWQWAGISQGRWCCAQVQEHFFCTTAGEGAGSSGAALQICLST